MRIAFLSSLCILLIAALAGCDRPLMVVNEGTLAFSTDTVKFDSIFTGFRTPSERLIVINNSNDNINISRINLRKGTDSEFSLLIDGIVQDEVTDLVIPHKDSIHIFVTLRSELKDNFAEEYIQFQVGEELQEVLIRAFVVDAYFFQASWSDPQMQCVKVPWSGDTLCVPYICDTFFTAEKPIVIDGPLFVPEGCTLTLEAGTHLYFTPFKDRDFFLSSMLIIGGTLKIMGEAGIPVVLEGSRLEDRYFENPGQWRGVRFLKGSKDNDIQHALIKNALVGVEVDSISINGNPKVSIRFSEIRNMAAYGLFGIGASPSVQGSAPAIMMENSLVHNCKDYTAFLLAGGNYEFYNCTFGNFSFDFTRKSPQLFVNNWIEFVPNVATPFDARAQFVNCIVWGNEEEELILDPVSSAQFDVAFDHCLIRTDPENEYDAYFLSSLVNQNPLYNDPRENDYRPQEGSPVINTGKDLSARYVLDIRGRLDSARYDGFDIGAYEYYPIEDE